MEYDTFIHDRHREVEPDKDGKKRTFHNTEENGYLYSSLYSDRSKKDQ